MYEIFLHLETVTLSNKVVRICKWKRDLLQQRSEFQLFNFIKISRMHQLANNLTVLTIYEMLKTLPLILALRIKKVC